MVWNVLDSDFTYTSLVMWLKGPTPQLACSMKTFSVHHCAAVQLLSHVQLFVAPWNKACQAPLSMGFHGQEYWSALPFPSPGHLPDPGVGLPSNSALVVALKVVCLFSLLYDCILEGFLGRQLSHCRATLWPSPGFWRQLQLVLNTWVLGADDPWLSLVSAASSSVPFSSVAQSCPALCNPTDYSTPCCWESCEGRIQACCFINCLILGKLLDLPWSLIQFSSVTQLCPPLCNPMDCSMPGFPVHHQLPELTQTHVHGVGDAIQPSHPLSCLLLLPSIFPSISLSDYSLNWG